MKIGFNKLNENATIPTYSNQTDAGMDLYAIDDECIPSGERKLIETGIAWEPGICPQKIYMQIQGRSGHAYKNGIIVLGGVIDEDYRGDIGAILYNTGHEDFYIKKGDRIAQGVIHALPMLETVEIKEFKNETERGNTGFGSTGN